MLDEIIRGVDTVLKTLFIPPISHRPHPDAEMLLPDNLSNAQIKHSIGLMRINHCGEVCAQALYQGQALVSRQHSHILTQAANEEMEHLAWTRARVIALGGTTSILNPVFYLLSFGCGIGAGSISDKWSLGFLHETEKQVEQHLERHLDQIVAHDIKSIAIIRQMKIDESKHAQTASDLGAAELPIMIKCLMKTFSQIMVKTTYYI